MKKLLILSASVASMAASMAAAGGWQASSLDTAFMYNTGSFAEISFGKVTPSIKAKTATDFNGNLSDSGRSVIGDENRTSMSFKTDVGNLSFGVSTYKYGSIQMRGGASDAPTGTWIPDADATIDTLAVLGKWKATSNIDVLFGMTRNTLQDSKVNTIMGQYDIASSSASRPVMGVAYSIPDIALRVEAFYMSKETIRPTTNFVEAQYGTPELAAFEMPAISYGDVVVASTINPAISGLFQQYGQALATNDVLTITNFLNANIGADVTAKQALTSTSAATSTVSGFDSTLVLPETLRLNFQTGVAADTLLFGSIEHVKWSGAQISVPTGSLATSIETEFADTTSYSLGVGRKLNEQWSISATYSREPGNDSTSSSLFTVSNGTEGVTLGARYTQGNMVVSGGVNYTRVGAVDIVTASGQTLATYGGNTAMGVGVKVGFTF